MGGQFHVVFRAGLLLALAAGVTACESGGGLPSIPGVSAVTGLFDAKEGPPLQGKRVSVLSSDNGTTATASVEAKEPVSIPAPQVNASWAQPGGVASNAPGHLAFEGAGKPVWREDAGSGSNSDGRLTAVPVVHNGKVYTLDREGRVTAFSASGGSQIWRVSLQPDGEKAKAGFGGGLAVDGGRIYAASGFGSVVALNADSGKQLWTKSLGVPIRTSPTAVNGKVFVVNSESQLYALSGEDGKELWSSRGLPEGASLLSNVSPAVSGSTLVVSFPSGEVTALDMNTGATKWTDSVSGGSLGSSLASVGDAARPVIDGDMVFATSGSGRMIATAAKTGERVWSKDIRAGQTPWVAGDTIFAVDTGGRAYALARKTGKTRWVTTLPDERLWSGPVLAGGKLWAVSSKGLLVGLDARSGEITAKTALDSAVFISPVVASGRMYVLTDKASLIALN
jgi:outer membrane protein assembly factor BamB